MKGIDLKFFLANKGYTVSRIAQMIDESQQNFSAAIKSDNIKTNLIERISAATGIPISEFYGEKKTTLSASMTGGNNNRMIAGNGNSMGDSSAELEALRRENELLKKWMAEKDGQIEFLRELLKK